MKFFRRILIVSGASVLVPTLFIAAFYAVEDWRGARAWAGCRSDLAARGESLDAATFIPPPVPDERNLAMAPLFVRMFRYRADPATGKLMFAPVSEKNTFRDEVISMSNRAPGAGLGGPKMTGDWATGHPLDLSDWQRYYRQRTDLPRPPTPGKPAEDILLALTRYAPILDELTRDMADRPLTRFPVRWDEPKPWNLALPQYTALQSLAAALKLRAVANLTLGRTDEAMRDLATIQRVCRITEGDPMLITLLFETYQAQMMLQAIWEGMKDRRWSDGQLAQIAAGLRSLDLLTDYKHAARGDRVFFLVRVADELKAHGGAAEVLRITQSGPTTISGDQTAKIIGTAIDWLPGGWYDQNKTAGCRSFQDSVLDSIDEKAHRVRTAINQAATTASQGRAWSPYTWLPQLSGSVRNSLLKRSVATQAALDEAVAACALERFYQARHAYPERLEALVPAYLDRVPVDVMDGAPLRYRLTPDGRYLLYSVGWNGQDDRGQVIWREDGQRRDETEGDWAWQYEELQPLPDIQRSR